MADPVVLRYWEELYHYSDGYKGCYNSTKANVNRMKIYLDNCSLQRPLDSKIQIRIALEAEAVVGILNLFESGKLEIMSSEVLLYEVNQNPNLIRQEYAYEVLSRARTFVMVTEKVEKQARKFDKQGIKPIDALHLASAEDAQADYFCTCDDQLLKKAKILEDFNTKVVSPVELIESLNNGSRNATTG